MKKINLWNFLTILGVGIMIGCALASIIIAYNEAYRECISDPLIYSSKYYEDKYGYEFSGSGTFKIESGSSPIIIYFSKDGLDVQSLNQNPMFLPPSVLNITPPIVQETD